MNRIGCLVWTCVLLSSAACTKSPGLEEPDKPKISAKNVRIELTRSGEYVVVEGRELILGDRGAWMSLKGDASVTIEGRASLKANAASITVQQLHHEIVLEGNVEAHFKVPVEEGPDAGP